MAGAYCGLYLPRTPRIVPPILRTTSEALANLLVHSLTAEFHSVQASVHLMDAGRGELVRIAHAGLETIAPSERIPMGEGFLGEAAAGLVGEDMARIDLEPATQACPAVRGESMVCPLAAGGRFLGLLHLVLPRGLANDYLYTRVPMTLAHHVAMAFHAGGLR